VDITVSTVILPESASVGVASVGVAVALVGAALVGVASVGVGDGEVPDSAQRRLCVLLRNYRGPNGSLVRDNPRA
jgi:hypothetical protein